MEERKNWTFKDWLNHLDTLECLIDGEIGLLRLDLTITNLSYGRA